MTYADFRELCLALPCTDSCFPFDEHTEVFRLHGKIFALSSGGQAPAGPFRVNLKCDPDLAVELRAVYGKDIVQGYHMNHRHWNTLTIGASVPEDKVIWLIQHSYGCVKSKLPRRVISAHKGENPPLT